MCTICLALQSIRFSHRSISIDPDNFEDLFRNKLTVGVKKNNFLPRVILPSVLTSGSGSQSVKSLRI